MKGYEIGFMIGFSKMHCVTLKRSDVPTSPASYAMFDRGCSGEELPLPDEFFEIVSRPSEYRITDKGMVFKNTDRLDAGLEWLEGLSTEKAYLSGLTAWLRGQSIDDISASQLRHPEALSAFKAALNGDRIARYEPQLINGEIVKGIGRMDLTGRRPMIMDKSQPDYIIPLTEKRGPSPREIAAKYGQRGYDLGKRVAERFVGSQYFSRA